MKRFFAGLGWFFALYFGFSMFAAMVIGAIYQTKTGDTTFSGNFKMGHDFGAHYGGIILLFSFLIAVVGTLGQVLPGTKKAEKPQVPVAPNKAA